MGTQWAPTHLLDNAQKEAGIGEQLESNIESYKCKDCSRDCCSLCLCFFVFLLARVFVNQPEKKCSHEPFHRDLHQCLRKSMSMWLMTILEQQHQ
jgi:hypothetical protein